MAMVPAIKMKNNSSIIKNHCIIPFILYNGILQLL